MSDTLRDRIAEALYVHNARELGFDVPDRKGRTAVPWERLPAGAKESWYPRADAILALPGISVVELPEPECVTDNTAGWAGWTWAVNRNVGVVIVDMDSGGCAVSPDQARKLAAALLAAADRAEREQ